VVLDHRPFAVTDAREQRLVAGACRPDGARAEADVL